MWLRVARYDPSELISQRHLSDPNQFLHNLNRNGDRDVHQNLNRKINRDLKSARTRDVSQVTDVSVFGGLEEAAKLLLPRGSRVLSASQLQVSLTTDVRGSSDTTTKRKHPRLGKNCPGRSQPQYAVAQANCRMQRVWAFTLGSLPNLILENPYSTLTS